MGSSPLRCVPLASEKRANLLQEAWLIWNLPGPEEWWKDVGLLVWHCSLPNGKSVLGASHLSPEHAFLTWPRCSWLLSQAPDVTWPHWGPPLRILAVTVIWWIVSQDQGDVYENRGYIYWGNNSCCNRNTHTQLQWLNKMKVYILLTQSLARVLALLQAMIPECFHLMALPSWFPWRLGLPLNQQKWKEQGELHGWHYRLDIVVTFYWREHARKSGKYRFI